MPPSEKITELDLRESKNLDSAFPIMKQLRTHLDRKLFGDLAEQMIKENYRLWAYWNHDQILGLLSTRVYTDFVRGSHLYIDDLVTDSDARSCGIGAALLQHAEKIAQDLKLPVLRLCCVLENEAGMKFYRREKWKERAWALVKKI
jgi:ribosomal protein S18 acetylase RimI-like enzyme